jgi:MarR family transcriptional regulator, organic hydroperoxide resistance regulator
MKPQETVDFNIKATWHAISRMYNQEASMHDFTTSIGFVLLNIDSENGTPATKIAPLMGLESRSLTRMLKTMEEKELIYRVPDEKDKRSVKIFLTEEGKRKKEISRVTVKGFNNYIRENVDPVELKTFFKVIEKINQLIDNKPGTQSKNFSEKLYEQTN